MRPRCSWRPGRWCCRAGAWAGELLAAAHQHGLSLSPLLGVSRSAAMGEAAAMAAVDHLGRVFQVGGLGARHAWWWWARRARPMALRPLPGLASRGAGAAVGRGAAGGPGGRGRRRAGERAGRGRGRERARSADTVGMRFTECMRGFFSTQVTEPDYARGAAAGPRGRVVAGVRGHGGRRRPGHAGGCARAPGPAAGDGGGPGAVAPADDGERGRVRPVRRAGTGPHRGRVRPRSHRPSAPARAPHALPDAGALGRRAALLPVGLQGHPRRPRLRRLGRHHHLDGHGPRR